VVEIRKLITMREMALSELRVTAPRPVVRAIGLGRDRQSLRAPLRRRSPAALRSRGDARRAAHARARQAARRAGCLLRQRRNRSVNGEMEHGGACVHPVLGIADAGGDRRRQGGDFVEREGRRGRCEPRCAARA
jgi:hypothetical protein